MTFEDEFGDGEDEVIVAVAVEGEEDQAIDEELAGLRARGTWKPIPVASMPPHAAPCRAMLPTLVPSCVVCASWYRYYVEKEYIPAGWSLEL